jgi:hypothetical protein
LAFVHRSGCRRLRCFERGYRAFGVLFGSKKREWLHNRFMGERIRQFHFQFLIARLPDIIASLGGNGDKADQAKAEFESVRHKLFLQFKQFKNQFERNVDGQFTSLLGPYGEADWWLHNSEQTFSPASHQQELEPLFAAYRHLRIKHQLGFANFKLQSDHRIFSAMPMRQAEILENIIGLLGAVARARVRSSSEGRGKGGR